MASIAAPDSDIMASTDTKKGISSLDVLCSASENMRLKAEVQRLQQKTRKLESENLLRAAESACDFAYGQMDRVVTNVRNINYGMDKLESAIDSIRRYDALRAKKEGMQISPCREAVSAVFLSMDHYIHKKENVSATSALAELLELTGMINHYFEMRCRPADCFSKGGWQDHMFMFVLPATDRSGANTFLGRIMRVAVQSYAGPLSVSYGIANYAADVREIHEHEESRIVASRLLDAAKRMAKEQESEFSGRIIQEAKYLD